MKLKPIYIVGIVAFIAIVVVVTAIFVPTNVPPYDTAVAFAHAAGKGDDATARSYLSPELQTWVSANCRDGSISACVDDYTPSDWGNMLSVVFRRAQPDGANAFDIQLVATYENNQGFSGVCIYTRVEQVKSNTWQVTRWSGWMSCDDPNGGLDNLINNSSVPNRAP